MNILNDQKYDPDSIKVLPLGKTFLCAIDNSRKLVHNGLLVVSYWHKKVI